MNVGFFKIAALLNNFNSHVPYPHDDINHYKSVMGLRQCFPGDGNTSQEIHGICPQENTSNEEKQWSFGSSRLTEEVC